MQNGKDEQMVGSKTDNKELVKALAIIQVGEPRWLLAVRLREMGLS